jgi:hypothetical protein
MKRTLHDNKIVFDKSFKNFNFDDIILSHEGQVSLKGKIKDRINKDLQLSLRMLTYLK